MASDPGVGAMFTAGASASVFSVSGEPRDWSALRLAIRIASHSSEGTTTTAPDSAASIVNQ